MDYICLLPINMPYISWIHFTYQVVGYWLQLATDNHVRNAMAFPSKRNAEMK
jgi:hypothetical protein